MEGGNDGSTEGLKGLKGLKGRKDGRTEGRRREVHTCR
jgi:hypothetical protein